MNKYTYEYLVMPKHLNPAGHLFGGQLISWIDESVYMAVKKLTRRDSVTASIKNFDFLNGASMNDLIHIDVEISEVGDSSCTCHIDAFKGFDKKKKIADSSFVMVTVDEKGKPIKGLGSIDMATKMSNQQEESKRMAYRDSCISYANLKL